MTFACPLLFVWGYKDLTIDFSAGYGWQRGNTTGLKPYLTRADIRSPLSKLHLAQRTIVSTPSPSSPMLTPLSPVISQWARGGCGVDWALDSSVLVTDRLVYDNSPIE